MAYRYLKFTYQFYIAYTANDPIGSATSDLSSDKFLNYPPYYMKYEGTQTYAFFTNILVPRRLRYYQQFVTFNDHFFLDLLNPGATNRIKPGGNLPDYRIYPTSGDMTFRSVSGINYGYTANSAYGWCTHAGIEMPSQYRPTSNGTAHITFNDIFVFFDDETDDYNALLAAYPNNVTPWFPPPEFPHLYFGDDPVNRVFRGDREITDIYVGSTKL